MMNPRRMICIFLLLPLALLIVDVPTALAASDVWVSDPGLTATLAPEETLGRFSIRPPDGYKLQQTPSGSSDGIGTTYYWVGPRNLDGTNPVFSVEITVMGSRKSAPLTSAARAHQELSDMQLSHTGFTFSPIATGHISGLSFAQSSWKGIGPRTGKTFHGVVYAHVAKPVIICITGKDEEPTSVQTLPLFEAAALTLRKR